eukprot:COSAG06_NODE_6406_length_2946_cov_1.458728_1_plen_218_part_00
MADPGAANKEKADLQTTLSVARFEIEWLQAELHACDDTERLMGVVRPFEELLAMAPPAVVERFDRACAAGRLVQIMLVSWYQILIKNKNLPRNWMVRAPALSAHPTPFCLARPTPCCLPAPVSAESRAVFAQLGTRTCWRRACYRRTCDEKRGLSGSSRGRFAAPALLQPRSWSQQHWSQQHWSQQHRSQQHRRHQQWWQRGRCATRQRMMRLSRRA